LVKSQALVPAGKEKLSDRESVKVNVDDPG
jgi:hypothetical protein